MSDADPDDYPLKIELWIRADGDGRECRIRMAGHFCRDNPDARIVRRMAYLTAIQSLSQAYIEDSDCGAEAALERIEELMREHFTNVTRSERHEP